MSWFILRSYYCCSFNRFFEYSLCQEYKPHCLNSVFHHEIGESFNAIRLPRLDPSVFYQYCLSYTVRPISGGTSPQCISCIAFTNGNTVQWNAFQKKTGDLNDISQTSFLLCARYFFFWVWQNHWLNTENFSFPTLYATLDIL